MQETVSIFHTKKEALKFVATISFNDLWQKITIIRRDKKWYVYYREWRDD